MGSSQTHRTHYCNDALIDPDTPWLLVSVTETDCIAAVKVLTFVKSPCSVSGSVTVNWLPNACDAALWYQAVKLGPTGKLSLVVATFSPATGVNVTSICVRDLPVA